MSRAAWRGLVLSIFAVSLIPFLIPLADDGQGRAGVYNRKRAPIAAPSTVRCIHPTFGLLGASSLPRAPVPLFSFSRVFFILKLFIYLFLLNELVTFRILWVDHWA